MACSCAKHCTRQYSRKLLSKFRIILKYWIEGQKLPQGRGVEEKTFIVSSLRLDNIVAAVCKLSREKTKTVIMSDSVCVNFEETKNVSFNLKENDVFTIRGKGKFVLKGILGTTGKGRMRISVIHYK